MEAAFTIRRLLPGDEAALSACTASAHLFEHDPSCGTVETPVDAAGAQAFLADPSVLFWVAEAEGRIIGMLHCYVQRRRTVGPWAELLLYEIGAELGWRRQGLGRALLAAMEMWMTEHGVDDVWVPSATTAVAFYAACGFAPSEGVFMAKQFLG